jgi:cysteine desulfurase/selenocysteine lyase
MLDANKVRKDFPIFNKNSDLIYLDSGATSLKPQSVIDAMTEYYSEYSANIKRGIYAISERATVEYEKAREVVAKFIGAETNEVVFTRNASESLNLLMYSLGTNIVGKNDEVVVTMMEHHSNFVTWQQLCLNTGATFKIIEIGDDYHLDIFNKSNINLKQVITKKTKILALTHVSNVLGTVNPIKNIVAAAKKINPEIIVIVDGAQAVPHLKINVKELGCDFYVFSGHKMMGPTGVGVLWGKHELLEKMEPFMFGGDMIREVKLESTTFAEVPEKFEAGTPAIAEVIGLSSAVRYLSSVGLQNIHEHELRLAKLYKEELEKELGDKITFYGPKIPEAGILAFTIEGLHPHDIASILNDRNMAVRAGHHCAMQLHTSLGLTGTTRISLYAYNTEEEIEKVATTLLHAYKMLGSIS